jgi:hypothetical protein
MSGSYPILEIGDLINLELSGEEMRWFGIAVSSEALSDDVFTFLRQEYRLVRATAGESCNWTKRQTHACRSRRQLLTCF